MALGMPRAATASSARSTCSTPPRSVDAIKRQRWDSAPDPHPDPDALGLAAFSRSPTSRSVGSTTASHRSNSDVPSTKDDADDDPDADTDDAVVVDATRDDVICAIFDLSPTACFYRDYACALAETFALHGRMYPTSTHLCFYSNVFGRERKLVLPLADIRDVRKTTALMFQSALRVTMKDGQALAFTNFWGNNRDKCFELVTKLHARATRRNSGTGSASGSGSLSSPCSPVSSRSTEPPLSPGSLQLPVPMLVSLPHSPSSATTETHSPRRLGSEPTPEAEAGLEKAEDKGSNDVSTLQTMELDKSEEAVPVRKEDMTAVLEATFEISSEDFVRRFLDDDATFSLEEYQRRVGATEIEIGPWTRVRDEEGRELMDRTRSVCFRIPVKAPIGPKTSVVNTSQSLKTYQNAVFILESSTRLIGFPYGDYFTVEEQWTITPQATTPASCGIIIEVKAELLKSTIWKGQIVGRSINDSREKWGEWLEMAKEHLESTTRSSEPDPVDSQPRPTDAPHRSHSSTHRHSLKHSRRAKSSRHHTANNVPPHRSRLSIVFPWLIILAMIYSMWRLQSSVQMIEVSLQQTSQRVIELQEQLLRVEQTRCGER